MSDEPAGDGLTEKPKRTRGPNKKKRAKRGPRKAKVAPESGAPESYAQIVSTKDVAPSDLVKLQAEVADLQRQLEGEREKRTAAESAALLAAEAQGTLQQNDIREIPTGRTRTVQRAKGYKVVGHKDSGVPIMAPVWHDIELPTYFYKIDLPPCGGLDLKINGVALYHGSTQEIDIDTLRTVKDIVHRCWAHDKSIHGSDENAYRPKKNNVVSARAYG